MTHVKRERLPFAWMPRHNRTMRDQLRPRRRKPGDAADSIDAWMRDAVIRPSSCEADLTLIRCEHVNTLYRQYVKWCRELTDAAETVRIVPAKSRTFGQHLRNRGCEILRHNVFAIAHSIERSVDKATTELDRDAKPVGRTSELLRADSGQGDPSLGRNIFPANSDR